MNKLKYVEGERVRIKASYLKQTSYYCGVDPGMVDLKGKVVTITNINQHLDDGSCIVKCGRYNWHTDDFEKVVIKPKPKGGSFKIENLVV